MAGSSSELSCTTQASDQYDGAAAEPTSGTYYEHWFCL